MYRDVRNSDGKLLFKWDVEKNAVELIHKGETEIIFLSILHKTYRIIRPGGRSPPRDK